MLFWISTKIGLYFVFCFFGSGRVEEKHLFGLSFFFIERYIVVKHFHILDHHELRGYLELFHSMFLTPLHVFSQTG